MDAHIEKEASLQRKQQRPGGGHSRGHLRNMVPEGSVAGGDGGTGLGQGWRLSWARSGRARRLGQILEFLLQEGDSLEVWSPCILVLKRMAVQSR